MKKFFYFAYRAYYRHPLRSAALSVLLSYVGYEWLFSTRIACGVVALLLLHELGHFAVARALGVRTGVPFLVPFLGAVVDIREVEVEAEKEARIALAGPLLGAASAVFFAVLYWWLLDTDWLLLAYIGALLNLFNLIPADPLDGGRVSAVLSPRLWWLGSFLIGLAAAYTMSLFIWLIFLFSAYRLWGFDYETAECEFFRCVKRSFKLRLLALYLALIGVLGALLLWLSAVIKQFS